MERSDFENTEGSIVSLREIEVEDGLDEVPDKSSEGDYLSLEYEDYNFVCCTTTPSFDEVSELEECNDTPLWVVGQQVYNEFQWSDSDQSEIDFELCVKAASNESNNAPSDSNSDGQKKNRMKYFKIKSGNIAKKIRLNITDISNTYLDKVKRLENYKKLLKMIGRTLEKDDPPVIVTPDESELQGMTEEEKVQKRQMWQQELAKIEEEIQTLRHVLHSKIRDSQELKRKLGISVWKELSDDLTQGVRTVKESNVYQKTESVVKATAESTRSLIGGLAGGFTQKIGQLKNSDSFRSFEEKVGSAYENVKTKVSSRSSSMQNFDDALREDTMTRSSSEIPSGILKVKPMP